MKGQDKEPVYKDREQPVEARVQDLLGRMNLREMVGQLVQYVSPGMEKLKASEASREGGRADIGEVDTGDNIVREGNADVLELFRRGEIGSFLKTYEHGEAEELQKIAAESRLGIPVLLGVDAIHGHGMYRDGATVFPTQLCLAGSFDCGLVEDMARITARELRAAGVHWTFSPNVDVARDPRWGRMGESFGEDPLLVAELGRAMVRGYQGTKPDDCESFFGPESVLACAKHFAGGGEPDNGINFAPLDVSERKLREVFLYPFREAVSEGCATVMAAHNDVNGVPCHGNRELLTGVLKEEWGFDGFVVSDWTDIFRLHSLHRVAESEDAACVMSVACGMDMHMHGPGFFEPVLQAVENGELPLERVRDAAARILALKFRLGMFDQPPFAERPEKTGTSPDVILSKEHREVSLDAARKSIVLLKNDNNLLPLGSETNRILVTGPNSASHAILGDWAMQQPEGNVVTILQGIKQEAGNGIEVVHGDGGEAACVTEEQIERAAQMAKGADAAIVAVGENSLRYSEGKRTCGENVDRSRIDLFSRQLDLVKAIHATGADTIVVFVGGRPIAEPWIAENVSAIIQAWEPGMWGGKAVAEIIFGKINPSGRLPVTIPRSVGHVHQTYDYRPAAYFRHYCDDEDAPIYEFGHGLSYTEFEYHGLTVPEEIEAGQPLDVELHVKNTGTREGEHVVLCYITDHYASVTLPVKRLAAFRRIGLSPGESQKVAFSIPPERFSVYDRDMVRRVEPGTFTVSAGSLDAEFCVR